MKNKIFIAGLVLLLNLSIVMASQVNYTVDLEVKNCDLNASICDLEVKYGNIVETISINDNLNHSINGVIEYNPEIITQVINNTVYLDNCSDCNCTECDVCEPYLINQTVIVDNISCPVVTVNPTSCPQCPTCQTCETCETCEECEECEDGGCNLSLMLIIGLICLGIGSGGIYVVTNKRDTPSNQSTPLTPMNFPEQEIPNYNFDFPGIQKEVKNKK